MDLDAVPAISENDDLQRRGKSNGADVYMCQFGPGSGGVFLS